MKSGKMGCDREAEYTLTFSRALGRIFEKGRRGNSSTLGHKLFLTNLLLIYFINYTQIIVCRLMLMSEELSFTGLDLTDSYLWNGMVHPFLNMTIYGVVWYQGETNALIPGLPYVCTFPAMIDDWRAKWYEGTHKNTDKNFPFGFVQVLKVFPEPEVTFKICPDKNQILSSILKFDLPCQYFICHVNI